MTHDELLALIGLRDQELTRYLDVGVKNGLITTEIAQQYWFQNNALRAVVELHKPYDSGRKTYPGGNREGVKSIICFECSTLHAREFRYPCPTIQAITRELL